MLCLKQTEILISESSFVCTSQFVFHSMCQLWCVLKCPTASQLVGHPLLLQPHFVIEAVYMSMCIYFQKIISSTALRTKKSSIPQIIIMKPTNSCVSRLSVESYFTLWSWRTSNTAVTWKEAYVCAIN